MSETERMPVASHELQGEPEETIPGWIVECTCGWTNRQHPAETRDWALDQFESVIR